MLNKIKKYLFPKQDTKPAPMLPFDMQVDIMGVDFESIYEAKELAEHIEYRFIADIAGQRWLIYPRNSPRLISK